MQERVKRRVVNSLLRVQQDLQYELDGMARDSAELEDVLQAVDVAWDRLIRTQDVPDILLQLGELPAERRHDRDRARSVPERDDVEATPA